MSIKLLDCTLRDGAYIVESMFGTPAIKGIIKHMQDANVDIIECGWLKDNPHKEGSSYYHVPSDMEPYLLEKNSNTTYIVMIDWNRYNTDALPQNDGRSLDAIRVVFPHGKQKEGIEVGNKIKAKGYRVFYQAANTLSYSNEELISLAKDMNKAMPESLSVVDTFGAMYDEDLIRIFTVLNQNLDKKIRLGFHSHNNQQLSFALTIQFVEMAQKAGRDIVVDASLCGMGRGAGNATTELLVSYLNRKQHANYDLNLVLDAIDMYMGYFQAHYKWGYSTPYFIAGLYCTHVNNIAYLLKNHRTNAQDMRNVIESLDPADRLKYDYDILEQKFLENQSRLVDDTNTLSALRKNFKYKKVLLLAPGRSVVEQMNKINGVIQKEHPVVIGINAFITGYAYDYVFFVNSARYEYAKEVHSDLFDKTRKITLSSIKSEAGKDEYIVNFNNVIKRGWEHFDNAVICCLRLLEKLQVKEVMLAGFDGFKNVYNESYADTALPSLNPENKWDELNEEIKDIFTDFKKSNRNMNITFVTESLFNESV